ncbi:MAG: hypothetical protein HY231_04565 [Acidobacteria bacterium]|nr:hypothetical protein [Acidobacteriota bacterium]
MLRKMFFQALLCSLLVLTGSTLMPVAAGGFQLVVEPPSTSDAEMKDAVLVVRTFGCHQPEDANVTAMAEGLVKGKRQTIPVHLTKTSKGVALIKAQWPTNGVWVLHITGAYLGITSSALVELNANGKAPITPDHKVAARLLQRNFTATEIDTTLQNLSDKLARR